MLFGHVAGGEIGSGAANSPPKVTGIKQDLQVPLLIIIVPPRLQEEESEI